MLRVWNVVLVAGAFCLSLFGTFLTRSGVINSIHSFTQSSIGAWFLGFIAVVAGAVDRADPLAAAAAALADAARVARLARGRLPLQQPLPRRLRADRPLGRPLSDRLGGGARRRGDRRRARTTTSSRIAFGLPLVLLMGIGPLVAWRRASLRALGASARLARGRRARGGMRAALAGAGSSPAGLVGYTFAAFVLAAIVLEFVRGTRAREGARRRELWPPPSRASSGETAAATAATSSTRRSSCSSSAPSGSAASGRRARAKLARASRCGVGDYTLALPRQRASSAAAERAGAPRSIWPSRATGRSSGRCAAGKNRYFAEQQTSNEVAIRSDWLRGRGPVRDRRPVQRRRVGVT